MMTRLCTQFPCYEVRYFIFNAQSTAKVTSGQNIDRHFTSLKKVWFAIYDVHHFGWGGFEKKWSWKMLCTWKWSSDHRATFWIADILLSCYHSTGYQAVLSYFHWRSIFRALSHVIFFHTLCTNNCARTNTALVTKYSEHSVIDCFVFVSNSSTASWFWGRDAQCPVQEKEKNNNWFKRKRNSR